MRLLEEYIGMALSDSSFNWNSTDYARLMVPSDLTIPDSIALDSLATLDLSGPGNITTTEEFKFLCPTVQALYNRIDGTIQFNVKASVKFPSQTRLTTDEIEMTQIDLKLTLLEDDGTETAIVDYFTFWSGSKIADVDTTTEAIVSHIYWKEVADVETTNQAKLQLYVKIYYTVKDGNSNNTYSVNVYCDRSTQDTKVVIPYVV
ncbi:hypothetical protein [Methanococcoides sp. AM1]|uniref:hypothetical protein n=1 Tax=Methanococcoides sp. AM1 TaxID=1201011 RepID=UPI0010839909|nr:hypothetical protein [Methanococcoides sp. AM1]